MFKLIKISVVCLYFCSLAFAVRTNFIGTGTDHLWGVPASWSLGVPTVADEASVEGVGTCIVDPNGLCGYLVGPGRGAGNTTLTVRGPLNVSGTLGWRAGYFGEGTLNVEPGAVITVTPRIYFASGISGSLIGKLNVNMSGGSIYTPGYFQFALDGAATSVNMNMSGGSISSGNHIYLGTKGNCTMNMTGGQISTPANIHLYMGFTTGTSELTVDGGVVNIGGALRMADTGATAILNVDSGSFSVGNELLIGHHVKGNATVNISGGAVSGILASTGKFGASNNVINMTGGEFNVTNTFALSVMAGTNTQINLDGGVMRLGGLTIGNGGLIDIEQGVLKVAGNVAAAMQSYIAAGKITGYGDVRNVMVNYDGTHTVVIADPTLLLYANTPSPSSVGLFELSGLSLSWTAGEGAVKHRVYFGDDQQLVADADTSTSGIYKGEVTDASYTLEQTLQPASAYYWRVDEIDGSDQVLSTGYVWTLATDDNFVLDDFEDYASDSELLLVWDGTVTLDDDYIIGVYATPKSMSIAYNTASETVFEFDSPKDFVVADVKSMTLYIHADKNNTAGQFYAKLIDNTGYESRVDIPDSDTVTVDYWRSWTYWPIKISDFDDETLDLSNIAKIAFGVDGSAGSGSVNIDLITLWLQKSFDFASLQSGDLDLSSVVDLYDFTMLAADWGLAEETIDAAATVSDDGLVFYYKFDDGSGYWAADDIQGNDRASLNTPAFVTSGGYDDSGALSCNGSVIVTVPASSYSSLSEAITISVWLKPESMPGTTRIFDAPGTPYYSAWASLAWKSNAVAGASLFQTSYTSASQSENTNRFFNIPAYDSQWLHCALVKDSASGFQGIYIDGELIAKTEVEHPLNPMTGFVIANTAAGNRGFIGLMDEFRCYNRALSHQEIAALSGQTSVTLPIFTSSDINYDGSVNTDDLLIMTENWLNEILWP